MESVITATTVTAAGALPQTLDTSALVKPATMSLEIQSLTAASGVPIARIGIEDSADGVTFTPLAMAAVQGPIHPAAPITVSWAADLLPGINIGSAGNHVRPNVYSLAGNSPTLTIQLRIHSF